MPSIGLVIREITFEKTNAILLNITNAPAWKMLSKIEIATTELFPSDKHTEIQSKDYNRKMNNNKISQNNLQTNLLMASQRIK